jgi:hypothetical protein
VVRQAEDGAAVKKALSWLFPAGPVWGVLTLPLMAFVALGLAGVWLGIGIVLLIVVNGFAHAVVWFTGPIARIPPEVGWRLLAFVVPWLGYGVFLWLRQR